MEREIDELFLDDGMLAIDKTRIENLEQCMEALPGIHPNLKQILSKCKEIHTNLELYSVKLESLASGLREIEEENTKLENEIRYQTDIYEHLKELLLNVEIKEDHFVALESANFESTDGLCRIEAALGVLCSFRVNGYDIRIVKERSERVESALRAFYKRFVGHIDRFLIGSRSSGELTVHRGLYEIMKRFRTIFNTSKRYKDYHAVMCSIYIEHARRLYEREFELHLKTVLRLLEGPDGAESAEESIRVLLESYKSLIRCEEKFLEVMGIERSVAEIFRRTSTMISMFVEDVYEMFDIETLNALSKCIGEEENEGVFGEFQQNLGGLYESLMERCVKREEMKEGVEDGVRRFEEVLQRSDNKELNERLMIVNVRRILKTGKNGLEGTIFKWWLIHSLVALYHVRVKEVDIAERDLMTMFDRESIEFVLADEEDSIRRLRKLLSFVSGERNFRCKIVERLRSAVLEKMDDEEKEEASMLIIREMDL